MSSSPDNFDLLLKLLALKRHEQPPPGYFAGLPPRVRARLEFEPALPALPWWRRVALSFELTPALACCFGVLVCALLLTGVVYSFQDEVPPPVLQMAGDNFSGLAVAQSLDPVSAGVSFQPSRGDSSGSPTPLGHPGSPNFLFNGLNLHAVPVNYTLGNP